MHELPVVEDMIKTLDKESEEKGIERITEINLVIGELSSIIGECVQMYFDMLSTGHSCEGAKLNFTHVSATLKCNDCGEEFPHGRDFNCPRCGGFGKLIKGTGREFFIKSVETS